MTTADWFLLGLPFVGAAHNFCANMGYRGWSVRESFESACRVGFMLCLISAALGLTT